MGQAERLISQPAEHVVRSEGPGTTESTSAEGAWAQRLQAWRADLIAISVLLGAVFIAIMLRLLYPNWLIDPDIYTMFLPWFGYIGDRAADLEMPLWMPEFFAGSAMVGNPSAGWLYIPVMIIFALWNVLTAYKILVVVQLLIGGTATYWFFRKIGLVPLAAMTGTAMFVLGPLAYIMTRYLVIGGQTNTWIPVAMLATEMSLRARRLSATIGWGVLIGLALVQIFAAWPSQGIMYAGIWVATWALYRTFIAPLDTLTAMKQRLIDVTITGASAVIAFFGFGAVAILPLIDYSAESSIPAGDYSHVLGSDYASTPRPLTTLFHFFMADNYSVRNEGYGAAILVMAVMAILIGRKVPAVPYFAFIFIFGASLCLTHSPTRWLLDLFPPFYHINGHRPVAVIWVLSLAPAFLVGALIQRLMQVRKEPIPRWSLIAITGFTVLALALANASQYRWIGWFAMLTMMATLLIFAAMTLDLPPWFDRWKARIPRYGLIGLIAIVFIFPTGGDIVRVLINPTPPPDGFNGRLGNDEELNEFIERGMARTDPGTAAEFLQNQQELLAPFRYTGYTGQGYPNSAYTWIYNTYWWRRTESGTQGVLANGRAVRLGLEQTSGYNPVQLMYMYEYINMMNGAKQDYHWGDVFASVWAAPEAQLLDMLNCRYILVDASIPENRPDHKNIREKYTEVFRDEDAIVYENPHTFPRAWLVHDVRNNETITGLVLLKAGVVDGREVAFVNGELPVVEPPVEQSVDGEVPGESVTVLNEEPESVTLRATAQSAGLVVISAAYSDGWNAYVDGVKVDVLRTNHALQGVAVSAGTHTIELKYEPRSVEIGMWTTAASTVGIIGVWGWALVDSRRRRSSDIADQVSRPTSTGGDAS
jgi:hypothetical protein